VSNLVTADQRWLLRYVITQHPNYAGFPPKEGGTMAPGTDHYHIKFRN